MGSNENNFKFGMLTEEYKPKKYYWEFFKMTYKMLLQVILVKFEMNIVMKGILIGVILTIYLLFQHHTRPFEGELFNTLDTWSTLVSFFSAQFALLAYN